MLTDDLAGISEQIDFFMPMGYDMNGMGAIVRNIGRCSSNGKTFCLMKGLDNCTDGSLCEPYNESCTGYGGDGR